MNEPNTEIDLKQMTAAYYLQYMKERSAKAWQEWAEVSDPMLNAAKFIKETAKPINSIQPIGGTMLEQTQTATDERADDCVSKKVTKLISEGYEQDQAAAIVYKMCEARDAGKPYLDYREMVAGDERSGAWYLATREQSDIAVAGTYAEMKPTWEKATAIFDQTGELDGTADIEEQYAALSADRACKPKKDEDTPRSIPSANTVQSGQVTLRFVDRAVTALDTIQGICRGYVAIWGDPEHRDAFRTYFDASRPPEMGIDNGMHRRPILYEHSQDGAIRMEIVGTITRIWRDDIGIAYEGELDRSSEFFPRIVEELQRGELKTSSATMEHTAEFYEDGAFRTWILGELSLTKTPAESRMPSSTLIRSQAHEGLHDATRAGDEPSVSIEIEIQPKHESQSQGEKEMTPEQLAMLQQLVAEFGMEAVMAALQQAQQQPAPAPAEAMSATPQAPADMRSLIDTVRATLTATQQNAEVVALRSRIAALEAANNAPPVQATETTRGARQVGAGVNVNVIEAQRFARFSHDELFLAAQVLTENHLPLSEGFRRSLAHRGLDYAQKSNNPDAAVSTIRSAYTRADDFMASDIAGKGTEWVGTFYGAEVWQKARTAPIMDMLIRKGIMQVEVPDGASNAVIPLEGSDPVVYTTAQSNDADATGNPEVVVGLSYAGTSNATVTPGELTTAVPYTDILSEDTVLSSGLVAQLNYQINEVMIRQPEYVFINGDTTATASTNINLIDGTPATGVNKPAYMVSDGARKLALVTNSAMSRDGGALDDDDYRLTLALFDGDVQSDPDRTAFVVDPYTYAKTLTILALKTRDVAGVDATLFTGKVPPLLGVDVFRSGQMAKANSAGKIPAAGGTLGQILGVYAPYWALVWKRRMTIENARVALAKSNVIIASMRLGFRYRSTVASAVSYNLTVS